MNFRHHFLFGVPSKISSFYHYFTDKALNILLINLLTIGYIILISFERVSRHHVTYKKTPIHLIVFGDIERISAQVDFVSS